MKFLIVAMLFLLQSAQAQQYGWVRIAQVGNTNTTLQTVEFVDSLHGWTASGSSAAFRTTDGGNTWLQCSFNAPIAITTISMLNPTIGWCVGAQGTSPGRIMKTTDGGANWFQQFARDNRNYLGTATLSLGKNVTSGSTTNSSLDTGKVVQTTNGGTTWTERTIEDSIRQLKELQFLDSLHGWVIYSKGDGTGGLLRTGDGGATWVAFPTPRFPSALCFIDTTRGWVLSNGHVYRTTNGGASWEEQFCICTSDDDLISRSLSFVDSLNGWAFGYIFYQGDFAGAVYRTTDGGWTWVREHVGLTSRILDGMMLDRTHGWAVGQGGVVLSYVQTNSLTERLRESPKAFALRQNYPNPFNSTTSIEYEIVESARVHMVVFDVTGKEVRSLADAEQEPGVYRIWFDGSGLASGVYFFTLKAVTEQQEYTASKQMIILK